MALTPEMQARYEANRLKMFQLKRNFRIYLWAHIILGAAVFGTAFFAGAMSTLDETQHGAEKFYFAMSAGVFQILLGLANIVFGSLASMKKRVLTFVLLGINLIGILMIMLQKNGTFVAANMLFLVAGLALNIWIQLSFNTDDLLQEEPGYPLFSETASQPAHYEVPLNVRAARPSGEMEGLSAAPEIPAAQPAAPVPEASPFASVPEVKLPPQVKLTKVSEESLGITDMPGNSGRTPAAVPAAPAPADVQLEGLTNTMQGDVTALPQVSAEAMLADMTDLPAHSVVQGDVSMLPTPDEVRERLAAMKRAREEHPQL